MATTHSPGEVAKVPPYLAINPGLFDSAEHWSYRDLQKLAKRLGNRAQMLQVYGAHFVHRECTAEVNAAIQLQVLSSESREDFEGNLSTILETSREWRGSGSVRDPTGATKREGHALEPEFV